MYRINKMENRKYKYNNNIFNHNQQNNCDTLYKIENRKGMYMKRY